MTCLATFNQLKLAVKSGSTDSVSEWLKQLTSGVKFNIHAYFCTDVPAHAPSCGRCETLLSAPLRRRQLSMIHLLLEHGAYSSAEICVFDYRYKRRIASTPLKRAVESGSLNGVRRLLTSPGAAVDDVNWHPRVCLGVTLDNGKTCGACD